MTGLDLYPVCPAPGRGGRPSHRVVNVLANLLLGTAAAAAGLALAGVL